jgi:hypothetical protein
MRRGRGDLGGFALGQRQADLGVDAAERQIGLERRRRIASTPRRFGRNPLAVSAAVRRGLASSAAIRQ